MAEHQHPGNIPNAARLAAWEKRARARPKQDDRGGGEHPARAPPLLLVPLDQEVRATLPTAEAAAHLGRAPQTLRLWACKEDGPLRPVHVNGRLAWRVADLRRILCEAA